MNSASIRTSSDADRRTRARLGSGIGRSAAGIWFRFGPAGTAADIVGWFVAWSLVLCLGVQVLLLVADGWRADHWLAYDTNAYWLAARHVLDGTPLYAPAQIWTAGAYKYPPLYAQMFFPIAWVPELIVAWAWRLTSLLSLRYLCGSWKLTVLAAMQWPVFRELALGNVTLQLGAVALWSFRDSRGAYVLPWFAGLKFGPALLIPYFWVTHPAMRRQLVTGCVVFGAACALSFAIAPSLWWDYAGTFGWESASKMEAMWVYAIVPTSGGLDFALRFAFAAALTAIAIRWRWNGLAFAAATCTMPIFSLTRLSVLCGLWPLTLRPAVERWRANPRQARVWLTKPLEYLDMLPRSGAGSRGMAT